jgi:hypothetical protein
MRYSASTIAVPDRSEVYIDSKITYWDADLGRNYILLDHEPDGEIISLVIMKDGESLVVDGKPNRSGKRIEFLYDDNLNGCESEVRYLIS